MKLHISLFIMAMASFVSFVSAQTCDSTSDCGANTFCSTDSVCTRYTCANSHRLLHVEGALTCNEYSGSLASLVYSCTARSTFLNSGGGNSSAVLSNIEPEASVMGPFNQFCSAGDTDGYKFYCYENSDNSNFNSFVNEITGLDLSCAGEEDKFKVVRFQISEFSASLSLIRTPEFNLDTARTSIAVSLSKGDNPFESFNPVVPFVGGDGSFANNIGAASAMVVSMVTAATATYIFI
jgi:hypothetical protein